MRAILFFHLLYISHPQLGVSNALILQLHFWCECTFSEYLGHLEFHSHEVNINVTTAQNCRDRRSRLTYWTINATTVPKPNLWLTLAKCFSSLCVMRIMLRLSQLYVMAACARACLQPMASLAQWGIDIFSLDSLVEGHSIVAVTYTVLKVTSGQSNLATAASNSLFHPTRRRGLGPP